MSQKDDQSLTMSQKDDQSLTMSQKDDQSPYDESEGRAEPLQ